MRQRPRRSRQHGQALIYGLFVLAGGLTALYFLFNTGQLAQEKTKLVNTADTVAYSAGVMHARLLNFQAYTNRAMVANSVAIGQLVSLSSWGEYMNSFAANPVPVPIFTAGKYVPYLLPYEAIKRTGVNMHIFLNLNPAATVSGMMASDEAIRRLLVTAQHTAADSIALARQQVMTQVAESNYQGEGKIIAEPLLTPSTAHFMTTTNFIRNYDGAERTRFAEVVRTAAHRDPFVPRRSWRLSALFSDCPQAMLANRFDYLERRGGTDLIDFDTWKAMDTLSEKVWTPRNKFDLFCSKLTEIPFGWNLRSAEGSGAKEFDQSHFDQAPEINPVAAGAAIGAARAPWSFSGLPGFYDLSADALASDDPRLAFAIRLRREMGQTATSEGRSAIRGSARLNRFQAAPAGGSEMTAIAASEVFFERPEIASLCPDGQSQGMQNCWGRSDNGGRGKEIGSLFNPYWQVRLLQPDADIVREARLLQGVGAP